MELFEIAPNGIGTEKTEGVWTEDLIALTEDAPREDNEECFRIDNDVKADWAARTVKREYAECDRLLRIADERIAALRAQKEELLNRVERRTTYLKGMLQSYFASVEPSRTTKTQTVYELLSAKLVQRRQAPEYVRDEETLVAWARKAAPEYVKDVPKLDWAALKKATELSGETVVLKGTGEVVEGVKAVARADVFEVM